MADWEPGLYVTTPRGQWPVQELRMMSDGYNVTFGDATRHFSRDGAGPAGTDYRLVFAPGQEVRDRLATIVQTSWSQRVSDNIDDILRAFGVRVPKKGPAGARDE